MDKKTFLLSNNIITKKNKINPCLKNYENRKHLRDWLYKNTPYETDNLSEIVYCIYYNINYKPICPICNKNHLKFDKFTKGFLKYCSHKCYSKDITNKPHWTEKASKEKINKVMNNMVNTRIKNGSYVVSDETKTKQSISAKKSMDKKQETWLKKYGVKNPGVLGGNSSKSALNYIKKFIKNNNIDKSLCFYHDPDNNKQEFFQMIDVPFKDKKKYTKYDLVVFRDEKSLKDKNINNIETVLEYNGPWHYILDDVLKDPNGPSTPYKNNKMTKKISYIYDLYKRLHFKNIKKYFIYWEKYNVLLSHNYNIII